MKKFNPEKELNKIKNGSKNKIIVGLCALLLIVVVGYSFALYQVRHSNKLVYTTVKDFSKDIKLAVYVNNEKQNDFPKKQDNLIYTKIDCDKKEIKSSWDYEKWGLELLSELPNKCNVYFETRYRDSSGASYPELYQGLIPITIGSNGEINVANLSSEWYDYDKHNWANAVLVTNDAYKRIVNEDGTFNTNEPISLDTDILQMYVWIPRYRYKLWNTKYETSVPQMIEIEFESNTTGRSIGSNNGQWLTHPAFLFGDTELNGFWVGKFEPSDAKDELGRNSEISEITILPNKTSMVNKTIKIMFDAEQKLSVEGNKYNLNPSEVDTRVMRNSEWGATVYLISSKYGRYNSDGKPISSGTEVWINNTVTTGCAGDTKNAEQSSICNNWISINGKHASTTDNQYGIYDMSGGMWEYVMGITKEQTGDTPYWSASEFGKNELSSKYYELYDFSDNNKTFERGHLGDATREVTSNSGNSVIGWNGNFISYPSELAPWFMRGASISYSTRGGVFSIGRDDGGADGDTSFRSVLSAA